MAREILFKAKPTEAPFEWVEGYLGRCEMDYIIGDEDGCGLCIILETICQYTGLTDKNGNKIWENDVVEIPAEDGYFHVKWDEDGARFVMNGDGLTVDFDNFWSYEVEVVGNIFDNPEMIE